VIVLVVVDILANGVDVTMAVRVVLWVEVTVDTCVVFKVVKDV
jgi:hypothetical protein